MKENLHFIGHDLKTGSGCLRLIKEYESAFVPRAETSGWVINAMKK